jgi:hypothetical protein
VGWANCFTQDGIFGQGDYAIRGRDNLRAYAEVHGRTLGSRHITASPWYQIDENGVIASGRSTTVVTVATPSGYKIAMTGFYEDELKKINNDWLISRRWATVEGCRKIPAIPCWRRIDRWPRWCSHCSTHGNVCLRQLSSGRGRQAALLGDVALALGTGAKRRP